MRSVETGSCRPSLSRPTAKRLGRGRFSEPRGFVVANGGKRLTLFNAIADALVKLQAHSVVDRIFLFLATAAEHGKGDTKTFAVCAGDIA